MSGKKKYVVKKEEKSVISKKKVKEIKGFSVKPRNKIKPEDMIDVDKLVVVDDNLIKKLIDKKVKRGLNKILTMYSALFEDEDAADGDWDLVLDEEYRFKEHVLSKYKEYMKKEELKKLLKELAVIEKEILNQKSLAIQDEIASKKGKGR